MRDDVTIGVVVVNWNGKADTIACLDSLYAAAPRPAQVVVVDNGSSDGSLDAIASWASSRSVAIESFGLDRVEAHVGRDAWITAIAAGVNLGFSGANNIGLAYLAASQCTHFLLLNNDAMVAPDFFAELAASSAVQTRKALVGCLIFRHPQRDEVWYSGGREISYRALVVHETYLPATKESYSTLFITGCAMLIPRELYEAIGGLAEIYNPIYWEDTDYSFCARVAGWSNTVVPGARVYHRVGASGGGEVLTPRTAFAQNRNRAFFVRRNYRGIKRIVALAYLIVTKPGRAVIEAVRGRSSVGRATIAGLAHGLLGSAK